MNTKKSPLFIFACLMFILNQVLFVLLPGIIIAQTIYPTDTASIPTAQTIQEIQPEFKVSFISLPTYISTPITVNIKTTIIADKVVLILLGPQKTEIVAVYKGENNYVAYINTNTLLDGNYTITARAIKGSTYTTVSANIVIKKTYLTAPADIQGNLSVSFVDIPTYITSPTVINLKTNILADKVVTYLFGPQQIERPANYNGYNLYSFTLNPTEFIDGSYKITAKAIKGTQTSEISSTLIIKKAGLDAYTSTTTEKTTLDSTLKTTDSGILSANEPIYPTSSAATSSASNEASQIPIPITFIDPLRPFSGEVKIAVELSQEIDQIYFAVKVPSGQYQKFDAIKANATHYYFIWHTKDFANGFYEIYALATAGSNKYTNAISGQIINISSTTDQNNTSGTSTFENLNEEQKDGNLPVEIVFNTDFTSPLTDIQRITVKANNNPQYIYFIISDGIVEKKYDSIKAGDSFYMLLNTISLPNGQYNLRAVAIKNEVEYGKSTKIIIKNDFQSTDQKASTTKETTSAECKAHNITSESECGKFLSLPETCRVKNISQEECDIYMSLSPACLNKGITSKEECDNYLYYLNGITALCKKYNLTTKEKCEEFKKLPYACQEKNLRGVACEDYNNLPDKCKSAKILNKEKCAYYLSQKGENDIMPECKKNNITSSDECKKYMAIPEECRAKKILDSGKCELYLKIPKDCREKNITDKECANYLLIPLECRKKNILNREKCKEFLLLSNLPKECQEAKITDSEKCSTFIFLKKMPQECKDTKTTTQEECNKLLYELTLLTKECKNKGIKNLKECDHYMADYLPKECREKNVSSKDECDNFLREHVKNLNDKIKTSAFSTSTQANYLPEEETPRECQEIGVLTKEECDKILFRKNMPQECQEQNALTKEDCDEILFFKKIPAQCKEANVTDLEKCSQYLKLITMPQECRERNVTDQAECQKIMFIKEAPAECIEKGLYDPESCKKYIFELHIPQECKEAKISNEEACKKYMFEKYNKPELANGFPLECQKANVKTQEECKKIMRRIYLPKECADQNISDEKECQTYLEKKHLPEECLAQHITSQADCEEVMFKKYSPILCAKVDIKNEEECKKFAIDKYAGQVECENLDEWQCRNLIEKEHLGNITAKQIQLSEIKEKVQPLAGSTIKASDLKKEIGITAKVIPLTNDGASFKIVAAEEKIIVKEDNSLINTSPVVLMQDSDKDGLPDDMEKRLGTDPYNPDSDNDGYDDGTEIKENFNPLGTGELKANFAPIDRAILDNKPIEQPKIKGTVSSKLAVSNIVNKTDTGKGYSFSGKTDPYSVVTLYIYSDLPLVLTAKADEFGNWEYDLNESLVDGEHEVYVTINDDTGKITNKSNPLNFFVQEAKAISVKDFVSTAGPRAEVKQTKSMINYYLIIAIVIISLAISLFIIFIIQRRRQNHG